MSIKIENVEVMGWEAAIRGMRNPMNSWEKSDSLFLDADDDMYDICGNHAPFYGDDNGNGSQIGKNDLDLMKRLRNAGKDHRKFMRMITVYADILAPLYWWKEFDTYKVGTVANSCSTMHKIHAKEFTLEDFSCEHLMDMEGLIDDIGTTIEVPIDSVRNIDSPRSALCTVIKILNESRRLYLETKDKNYWWQMIQLLPSSYNQKRTVMLNYEVLANMYHSRKNHKLDEWREFCKFIETLPYSELIAGDDGMYSSQMLDPKYQNKSNESEN